LEVAVFRQDAQIKISVSDDGAGIKPNFDPLRDSSLGLEIVRTLTENELSGELRFERLDKGTKAEIEFSLN
jgi:two-component sensor histidine kinase